LEDRLQANVDALDLHSGAQAVLGRSAFCKELFRASSSRSDGTSTFALGKSCVSQHHALYANVSPALKRKYNGIARELTAVKKTEHGLALQTARTDLRKCKAVRAAKLVGCCNGIIAISTICFVLLKRIYPQIIIDTHTEFHALFILYNTTNKSFYQSGQTTCLRNNITLVGLTTTHLFLTFSFGNLIEIAMKVACQIP
jgi:hypothetical protein